MVGDDFVWTVEEALLQMEKHPDKAMYVHQTREMFLSDICRYNGAYLVDEEEGVCRFDTGQMEQLLEYAKTLPEEELEPETVDERDWVYRQICLLDKLAIIGIEARMQCYRRAKELYRQGAAQDEFMLFGFPSMDESAASGSVFSNLISLSMASGSQKKEEVWSFFQYLLSDVYQRDKKVEILGYPIKESIIQEIMEAQKGETDVSGMSFFNVFSGWEIYYGYATQEDIDTMNDLLYSVDRLEWENDAIFEIVQEEAQYYFAGEHTAKEAVSAMQNRVELYLMEKG